MAVSAVMESSIQLKKTAQGEIKGPVKKALSLLGISFITLEVLLPSIMLVATFPWGGEQGE